MNTRIFLKNQKNVSIDMSFLSYNISIFHISYKQFNMRRRIISVIIALLLLLGSSQASSAFAWTPQESNTQRFDLQETSQAEAYHEPIERPEYEPPSEESLRLTKEQVQAFDCGTVTDVPRVECEALVALYQSTNGSAWTDNSNWLQSTTVGDWKGIRLDNGRVRIISLNNNNLYGTLPDAIGTFVNLEYLTLSMNNLWAEIPSSIGQLINLTTLYLTTNYLSGSIPASLGTLKDLTKLSLAWNRLSGSLPSSLGNLTKLDDLNLMANHLSGTIPPELGHLIQLEELNLRLNNFTGQIPSEIGNLVNLRHLDIGQNAFSGDLPVSITKLVNLCGGTDNPAGCEGWETTDFGNNYFKVPQPEPQNSFMNIKDPDWAARQMTPFDCDASVGVPVSECEALVDFYFSMNGKRWYKKQGWLSSLGIENWQGVYLWGGHVMAIVLNDNIVGGQIPESIADLTGLSVLSLQENEISGNIPKALGDLSELSELSLNTNQMSGPIPSELGNLLELTTLGLSDNRLSGKIPPELGNLSKLEKMNLSYNKLEGTIPEQLGQLGALDSIMLDYNQLSGRIPATLGQLSQLTFLQLNNNLLNGKVPDAIGSLTNLRHLWINDNKLSGNMPASITKLVNLCGGTDNPAGCKLWQMTDFGNNCFNVPQPEPQNSFMTTKDPDWADTQRVCETWVLNLPIVLRP